MGFVGLDITEVRKLADDLEKASSGASRLHRDLGDLLHRASEGYGGRPASSDPSLQGVTTGVVPGVPAYGVRAPGAPTFNADAVSGTVPGVLVAVLPDLAKEMRRRCGQAEAAGHHPDWHITTAAAFNDDHMPLPKGTDPKTVKSWWSALPKETRDDLIASEPHKIGALDGVPVVDRDEANRLYLPILKAKLHADIAARKKAIRERDLNEIAGETGHGPAPGAAMSADDEIKNDGQIKAIEKNLASIDKLEGQIGSTSSSKNPPMYLLGVSTEMNGRAIVAAGDPDKAKNVVTYVPGMTTNLANCDTDIQRARAMQVSAAGKSPAPAAAVMWLGYDAPPDGDAASPALASRGAPKLDKFLTGLRSSHDSEGFRSTLLGHSYGSLVSGKALMRNEHPPVDQAIFVGSPGVGAKNIHDLHLDPKNVWAGRMDHDIIKVPATASNLGNDNPNNIPGVPNGPSGQTMFGIDPMASKFGANILPMQTGPSNPASAHTSYWTGSSLESITDVVDGEDPR